MQGIFAADLTLAEVRQLRARQRWAFRDHSHDGLFGIATFEEFIDSALAAGRPVGIYPGEQGLEAAWLGSSDVERRSSSGSGA